MMELPCLALHCYDHSTVLFSASKEKLIVGDRDTDKHLQNKTICPTARGLLLVRDPGTLVTFLWNPQDGDRVHLPSLQGLEDAALMHSHCLLSDEPSAPGCVVLLVEAGGDDSTFLWYCRPGDDTWVKHGYDIGTQICSQPDEQERYEKTPICPIAACRGKFYFNASSTELGVLEFSPDPVFSFVAVDDDEEVDPREAVFLVESGDELYRVTLLYSKSYGHEIDDGFVDRWDFSELRWHSVEDLGGRTFLLSRFYFAASCPGSDDSEHGLRQDCVYYIAYPRKKEMQIFDVREGTNCLRKLDEAPTAHKAFWLLPAAGP